VRGLRGAIWFVNGYGFVLTALALLSAAVALAVVVAGVLRAVSHLPLVWIWALGCAAGFAVLIGLGILTSQVLGAKLHVAQVADACWATKDPAFGLVLTGSLLISNSDPVRALLPTSIRVVRLKVDDGKRDKCSVNGHMTAWGKDSTIAKDSTDPRMVSIILGERPEPSNNVIADVVVNDQFNHKHRGRVTFYRPPPVASNAPAGQP
jgi:hypothetical protein